ncbi:hypothetical protein [Marilutibacter chinensis]|uniref:Secreted protein n=1 Tax=Marilutibacter chinensis TaxID=2912247 RepID=A0ABS9HWZ5_9GAMM|nr:hypothetical protein [Lysobacter chinensis]MCF7223253.1 hypothetical protein [Lysobacter chinensis]
MNPTHRSTAAAALLVLAACGTSPPPRSAADVAHQPGIPATETAPADRFMERVRTLCGQAFAGRIVANQPPPAGEDPFTGQPLVMHVRDCDRNTIRIPLHVGADRSRTWVLDRTADGLRLKHDHRHEDGSEDVLTMYGGLSAGEGGTGARQEFPVDAESRELFAREGLAASIRNTWAMEIEPGSTFVYELSRPGRLFRIEFDLGRPVDVPPAPWGQED